MITTFSFLRWTIHLNVKQLKYNKKIGNKEEYKRIIEDNVRE